MTTENKQPDERAAFEEPAPGFIANAKTISAVSAALGAVREYANDRVANKMTRAVNMLLDELGQARATTQQANKGDERDTAEQQRLQDYAEQNMMTLEEAADELRATPSANRVQPTAPQAVTLSDEQIKQFFADLPLPAWARDIGAARLKELLATHPTEQRISDAGRDLLAERARQVSVEGWTPAHDDGANDVAALADAAACYTMHAAQMLAGAYCAPMKIPHTTWPWNASWWKPTTPRRDLVKAGALILAEIERIDRAARKGDSQ